MGHTGDGPPNTSNWHPQIHLDRHTLDLAAMEAQLIQAQACIKELEALVREMGGCVRVVAEAEQRGDAKTNHYVFTKFGMKSIARDILNRPEVKVILEKTT